MKNIGVPSAGVRDKRPRSGVSGRRAPPPAPSVCHERGGEGEEEGGRVAAFDEGRTLKRRTDILHDPVFSRTQDEGPGCKRIIFWREDLHESYFLK